MGLRLQSCSLHLLLIAGATGLQNGSREPDNAEDLLLNMFAATPAAQQTFLHPLMQVAAEKAVSASPVVGAGVSAAIANMMSSSSSSASSGARASKSARRMARAPAPSKQQAAAAMPMVKPSPSPAPEADSSSNGAEGTGDQAELIAKWFTWEFWHVIVYCAVAILVWSEVANPLLHMMIRRTFLSDTSLFFLSMITFLFVSAYFADPNAAGSKHALTLSTIMTVVAFLMMLFAISLKVQKGDDAVQKVADDVAGIFVPLTRVIAVFLIVQGVLDESEADWGNLVVFGSMCALGLAFALGGLVKDVISYFFIRLKKIFKEGDFIYYQGQLFEVMNITWMFTQTRAPNRSIMFIPNAHLALTGVMNQSCDDSRIYEADLPLPGGLKPGALEAIVRDAWTLLRGVEASGFTALCGKEFDSQIDVDKSGLYLTNIQNSASMKEFAVVNLHLRLLGSYYFSHPPPWPKESPTEEPPLKKRQKDWFMNWNYQIEWIVLEMHKIIDAHSA